MSNEEPVKISNGVALAYILENGLTKQQYINTKQLNNVREPHISWLWWNKKSKDAVQTNRSTESESVARVSLQDLLSHTAERILILQKEVLEHMENVTECILIAC